MGERRREPKFLSVGSELGHTQRGIPVSVPDCFFYFPTLPVGLLHLVHKNQLLLSADTFAHKEP
jgi:hypothetical protein